MNIQLSQAVSDITGLTGQAILRAIVAGERDPYTFAAYRDRNCKKSEEEIAQALTGTWREEYLFILKQSLDLYDYLRADSTWLTQKSVLVPTAKS